VVVGDADRPGADGHPPGGRGTGRPVRQREPGDRAGGGIGGDELGAGRCEVQGHRAVSFSCLPVSGSAASGGRNRRNHASTPGAASTRDIAPVTPSTAATVGTVSTSAASAIVGSSGSSASSAASVVRIVERQGRRTCVGCGAPVTVHRGGSSG